MDDYEEYTGEGSGQDLFGTSESDDEQERILSYAEYTGLTTKPRYAVLQTSDSSDDDEDQRKKQLPLRSGKSPRADTRLPLTSSVSMRKQGSSSSKPPQQTNRAKLKEVNANINQESRHTISTSETRSHSPTATVEGQTLKELEKTNMLLGKLVDRMKKMEERVRRLEDSIISSSSTSSSSTPKRSQALGRRKNVPPEVRVSNQVRVFFTCLYAGPVLIAQKY